MTKKGINTILTYLIATVWLINGLYCKVLNLVPRHKQIVSQIIGDEYSSILTIIIGLSEILMCIWILTRIKTRLNSIAQIAIVTTMNILEFILVPDLLLWGHFNALFALLFVLTVYYQEYHLKKILTMPDSKWNS